MTPLVLDLCLAAILFLNLWPSNRQQDKLHGFSSSPLLRFSVFNMIIIVILVGNYRPSQEVDGAWPPFLPLNEGLGEEDMKYKTWDRIEEEDDNNDEECFGGSDGYVEDDDDDDTSDDDIFWQEEEEDDDCLNRRIESFIAKVNEQWRKERLRDLCTY
ncbi:hypothetical protein F2P56_006411 [Juglans regia]|uniref:Uncharacterized protein n=2 Tax=Juglans regia TaxID=51240 RepID=A0A833XXU3_JUGRE|nr:uncharacterized protein LOC109004385 [Juglans regia]KAF5474518.1 hypothetical protein F2P56_006411 [Juglans regia]